MALSTIGTGGIADSAISTAKIAADAVTAVKIDDDGTGFTFGDLTVSGAVVGDGFVSVDKLKLDSSSVATVTVNSAVSASATIVVDGVAGTIVVGMVVNVSDTTVRSITDAASQSAISVDDTLTITAVASQTSFTVSEAVTIADNVVLILTADESGGFVLDASAASTDVGEEILFESATADGSISLVSSNAENFIGTISLAADSISEGGSVTTNITQGLIKAWNRLDGDASTLTTNDSFGISGIVDIGVARYTSTLTSVMINVHYAVSVNVDIGDSGKYAGLQKSISNTTKVNKTKQNTTK